MRRARALFPCCTHTTLTSTASSRFSPEDTREGAKAQISHGQQLRLRPPRSAGCNVHRGGRRRTLRSLLGEGLDVEVGALVRFTLRSLRRGSSERDRVARGPSKNQHFWFPKIVSASHAPAGRGVVGTLPKARAAALAPRGTRRSWGSWASTRWPPAPSSPGSSRPGAPRGAARRPWPGTPSDRGRRRSRPSRRGGGSGRGSRCLRLRRAGWGAAISWDARHVALGVVIKRACQRASAAGARARRRPLPPSPRTRYSPPPPRCTARCPGSCAAPSPWRGAARCGAPRRTWPLCGCVCFSVRCQTAAARGCSAGAAGCW